jgi:integrase/recombinase XerD
MEIVQTQHHLFNPVVVGSGAYVANDQGAVRAFLRQLETSPFATERAYKKEIRRFLAWLLHVGYVPGDALRSLNVIDLEDYFRFLRSPALLPKSAQDGNGHWKGAAPLSPSSLEHAKTLLSVFFDKLQDYEAEPGIPFRTTNPVRAIGRVTAAHREERQPGEFAPIRELSDQEKILEPEDIALIRAIIAAMPRTTDRELTHYHRTRWVFALTYSTWLRLSELANVQMGDFWFDKEGLWRLYVHPSKHEQQGRLIDVLPGLMEELEIYRKSIGLMPFPIKGERQPAILQAGHTKRSVAPIKTVLHTGAVRVEEQPDIYKKLGERAIFEVLKSLFRAAAEQSRTPWQRSRLRAASPHWLRHSGITHALNAGMDVRYVSSQARHKGIKTTLETYDHGLEVEARRREMGKLMENRSQ